jgi:hypothetical protein
MVSEKSMRVIRRIAAQQQQRRKGSLCAPIKQAAA